MEKVISIIGAGELGQAMRGLLQEAGAVDIRMWDVDPMAVPDMQPLNEVVEEAAVVFMCVPSYAMYEAVNGFAEYLKPETIVVVMAKGLEKDSKKNMAQLMDEVLPVGQPWAVMSGPMLAEEIDLGSPAAAVVASDRQDVSVYVGDLFEGSRLHISRSNDPIGVALAGVLKNVYAVGLSIVNELKKSENVRGWYVQQALKEMAQIIDKLGGNKETAYGMAGLGDLVATGMSRYSRNCQVGQEIVKTGKLVSSSEGTVSLPLLAALLNEDLSTWPILQVLQRVIDNPKEAEGLFTDLLRG